MSQTDYDLAFLNLVDAEFSVQKESEMNVNARKDIHPNLDAMTNVWIDILTRGKWSE